MKTIFLSLAALLFFSPLSFCAEDDPSDRIPVIREGQQLKTTIVTVEAWLAGQILEVTVGVHRRRERMKVNDLVLTGPGLGKIRYRSRKSLPPSVEDEDEETFEVTRLDGLIKFGSRTREKVPLGRLNRVLFKLKVPVDKIVSGKKYELVVEVESEEKAKRVPKFTFELEDFAEKISR
jgi:hypothetical protein